MKTLCFVLISVFLTFAQNENIEKLMKAKTIKCFMKKGSSANWDNNKINIKQDTWDEVLVFDNINLPKNTARFIANQGSCDVMALFTGAGLTLIETTPAGGLTITTVYHTLQMPDGSYCCVHSRHVYGLTPFPSQYYGYCKIIESN
jgi:hypothetical protein